MESPLQHVRPAVGRQRTGELIGIGTAAHLLAVEAEIADLIPHVARIIQRIADHIRDLGQGAVEAGLVKRLVQHIAVDIRGDGRSGQHAALAGHGGVDIAEGENRLRRGPAQGLQVLHVGPVGHGLDGLLRLRERGHLLGGHHRPAGEHRLRGLRRIHQPAAAHDHGLVEQALGQRRSAQELDAARSGALPENHHIVRIAAELGDIALDPLQDGDLVERAPVARGMLGILRREGGMGEEAERPHAVVERHEHDILAGPLLAVELRLAAPALAQAAAEDPHGHRQFLVHLPGRLGPDIQIEAILAVRSLVTVAPLGGVAAGIMGGLESRMAEFVADAHPFPGHDGLRGTPAVLPDGRCGIRDAAENGDARQLGRDTLDKTSLDGEDGTFGRLGRTGRQRQRTEKEEMFFHTIRIG